MKPTIALTLSIRRDHPEPPPEEQHEHRDLTDDTERAHQPIGFAMPGDDDDD